VGDYIEDHSSSSNKHLSNGTTQQISLHTYSDTHEHLHRGDIKNIVDTRSNQTSSPEHMFLTKYVKPCKSLKSSSNSFGTPERKSRVFLVIKFQFSSPQKLKGLKIWNYNAGKEG